MGESVELHGVLKGHIGWVTCISNCHDDSDTILSGGRDKSIIIWKLSRKKTKSDKVEKVEGVMHKRLTGHNHFISGIDVSVDRQYAISSSWDGSLRLWNLNTGETHKKFFGHKKDVLSVAFSADNRKIVSGGRDKTIKVWNVVGQEKVSISPTESGHKDWVTCCRFSPNSDDPVIVSCGRDSYVKVWQRIPDQGPDEEKIELKHNLKGHENYVNSVTVSPDGSLCASGGKDGTAMLWDLNEGKSLSSLEAKGEITCLTFSPNRYWLCGAVGNAIKIWDLETKDLVGTLDIQTVEDSNNENKNNTKKKRRKPLPILCTCICWSQDGKTIYAGYTDGTIRIWALISGNE